MTRARETISLDCLRWNPEGGGEPRWQRYTLSASRDLSVLEVLQQVKDELDGSLTFRWSCRMAVCGSCGMMIDGAPRLACRTFLRDLAPGPVRVAPLAHFPIVRDLVADQTGFLDHLETVTPYLIGRTDGTPAGEPRRQSPAEVEAYLDQAQCMHCLLCYAACPRYGSEPDFAGPAALAIATRWNADSRDSGEETRAARVDSEHGIWGCTLAGSCSAVCPNGVDPARAITRAKVRSALRYAGLRGRGVRG